MCVDAARRHLLPSMLWLCGVSFSWPLVLRANLLCQRGPRKYLCSDALECFGAASHNLATSSGWRPQSWRQRLLGVSRSPSPNSLPNWPSCFRRCSRNEVRVHRIDLENVGEATPEVLVVALCERTCQFGLVCPLPIVCSGRSAIQQQQPGSLHILDERYYSQEFLVFISPWATNTVNPCFDSGSSGSTRHTTASGFMRRAALGIDILWLSALGVLDLGPHDANRCRPWHVSAC